MPVPPPSQVSPPTRPGPTPPNAFVEANRPFAEAATATADFAVKFFEDAIKSAAYKMEHHPKDVPMQPGMPTVREARNLYADGEISREQVNDAIAYWKAQWKQNPKRPLVNVDDMPEFQPIKGPHYVKKKRWVRGYGADRSRWEPYVPALED